MHHQEPAQITANPILHSTLEELQKYFFKVSKRYSDLQKTAHFDYRKPIGSTTPFQPKQTQSNQNQIKPREQHPNH
jgi:hypothetical protein